MAARDPRVPREVFHRRPGPSPVATATATERSKYLHAYPSPAARCCPSSNGTPHKKSSNGRAPCSGRGLADLSAGPADRSRASLSRFGRGGSSDAHSLRARGSEALPVRQCVLINEQPAAARAVHTAGSGQEGTAASRALHEHPIRHVPCAHGA